MMRAKRKDFLEPIVAGTRLLQLAIEHIFCAPTKVKWSISISYAVEEGIAQRTFQSGPEMEMQMMENGRAKR